MNGNYQEILDFLQAMRWQDWVDILIVAFIIYHAIRIVRGTRSMQMLLGMAVVLGAYVFSMRFDLLTLNWLLSNFLTYIIIIIVILFQSDIRRALTRVAQISFGRTSPQLLSTMSEVVRAAFKMAEKRTGALIAFERGSRTQELHRSGHHPGRRNIGRSAAFHFQHGRASARRRRGHPRRGALPRPPAFCRCPRMTTCRAFSARDTGPP